MNTFIRDSFRELSTSVRYIFLYYCLAALLLALLSSYLEIRGVRYSFILTIIVVLIIPLHFAVYGIRRALTVSPVEPNVQVLAYRIFPANVEQSGSQIATTQVYLTGGFNLPVPDPTSAEATIFAKALTRSMRGGGRAAVLSLTKDMLADVRLTVRSADVALFTTTDASWPFEINPLRLAEGEDLEFKVRQNMLIFEWMLTGLELRAQELFREALYAVVGAGNGTLSDVSRLIDWRESAYRSELIRALEGRDLNRSTTYWTDVYPRLSAETYQPLATALRELLSSRAIQTFVCTANHDPDASPLTIANRVTVFDLTGPSVGTTLLLGQLLLVAFRRALTRQPSVTFSLYADQFWSCSVESLFVEPIAKLTGFGHRTAGAN